MQGQKQRRRRLSAVIVVEFREFNDPEIAENHGVKIESQYVAKAESAVCEENRDHGEGRCNQRGRVKAGLVERQDLHIRIIVGDVTE